MRETIRKLEDLTSGEVTRNLPIELDMKCELFFGYLVPYPPTHAVDLLPFLSLSFLLVNRRRWPGLNVPVVGRRKVCFPFDMHKGRKQLPDSPEAILERCLLPPFFSLLYTSAK